jgi:hypothetical protein
MAGGCGREGAPSIRNAHHASPTKSRASASAASVVFQLLKPRFPSLARLCRSHSIMVFALRNMALQPPRIVGKLSFIDLAGSERGAGVHCRAGVACFACVHPWQMNAQGTESKCAPEAYGFPSAKYCIYCILYQVSIWLLTIRCLALQRLGMHAARSEANPEAAIWPCRHL